ncbi:hypothetical protein [Virgibacillus kimchii]
MMNQDIYRSIAEDNMRNMRRRAEEHKLYMKSKKGKNMGFKRGYLGLDRERKKNMG